MKMVQWVLIAAAISSGWWSFTISERITEQVNEGLGTQYDQLWSFDGERIWKAHQELFPSSKKRALLAAAVLLTFSFLILTGVLAR